ncbi:ABC transporter permease [Aromatoleum toluolicum]|nr:ABC transporter permease [Aromatoleum toluolicum]NMF99529.2 ABC transporter permease [Aromatoleum toluolicum]
MNASGAQGWKKLAMGFASHAGFLAVLLATWEWAARMGLLDPTFFGNPAGIISFLWANFVQGTHLWIELGWSVMSTLLAFISGSLAAVLTGLIFVIFPRLERFLDPYFSALNALPRIALAPLFILWFGLGIGSKIAMGFTLTFFIVLSSTVAGMRGINQDHIVLTDTLGASPRQKFFLVTLPGAIPVIFSGLRLGLIYALLGVIAGEILAAEHGLGQQLAYLASTFNMNGVMALLVVLAWLGMAATSGMTRLERHLLRWQ